ncbi:hypothetical protein B9T31_08120 [Acinetobacter sp. ANC 4558]|uniref:hypothetical protein n=1 Tax=Acinetobacter sp. ANC 4558 TaxID=1977876 RepID=UPI000A34F551|nr:hypothetical protein [Acinetobacter sp. ANC 4558]OTG86448.1 hypothetical protein B9T31_08120 [Acinetobacter sp. ANC 4558]
MKKLLISTLCISAFALTACDKKTENVKPTIAENSTVSIVYSDNVTADMNNDLEKIQTLSNTKAQEALKFQTDLAQAAQTGEKSALEKVIQHMTTYVEGFNKDLDALTLKSNEGNALRTKMKEVNHLSIELAEMSMKNPPDIEKITALQKKSVELQQSLLQEIQAIQTKTSKS